MSDFGAKLTPSEHLCAEYHAATDPRSDKDLMAAVSGGDVEAFTTIVERHLRPVYRHCMRLLNDRHEAEDMAQESFARLWQCAPNWRNSGGGVPAWLHRVGTNLCFDRLRQERKIISDKPPQLIDSAPSAIERIEATELESGVRECLAGLPDRHHAALLLCYYEGYSNAAAAQIMDVNIKAFESLLLRARRRMSNALHQRGIWSEDLAVLA